MSEQPEDEQSGRAPRAFDEGEHFYLENGLMVLTAKFLRERGFCCGNLCRHCPYPKEVQTEASLKKKFV